MRTATLTLFEDSPEGSLWNFKTDSGFRCLMGGLPWRNNSPGKSCIPFPATYQVRWRYSPAHGLCYHVDGVPGRTDVEIHSANLMGDVEQGYQKQVLGCFSPGQAVGVFKVGESFHVESPAGMAVKPLTRDQRGMTASKATLAALEADLKNEDFELTLIGGL